MSRRTFIRAGLGLLLAVPAAWTQSIAKQPSQFSGVQAICSLSRSNDSAVRLGKKYLLHHPEYRNARLLTESIFSGWSESKKLIAFSEPRILKEILNRQIRQDFRLNNVSSLDGWVLSNTELRQWALLSLVFS
jgi:hypothetical protein